MGYRYSRWDGSQDVSPFTAEDIMEAMADDLIADGDLRSALQRLTRWGAQNENGERMQGIQDLLDRLRERKQEQTSRYKLDSVLEELKKRLEDVLQTERGGIQRRLDHTQTRNEQSSQAKDKSAESTQPSETDRAGNESSSDSSPESSQSPANPSDQSIAADISDDQKDSLRRMLESMAKRKLQYLENLPPDFAGSVKSLTEYEFLDPDAQQKFQDLLKQLEQQILGQRFEGMKQQIQNMSPDDVKRMREMVKDLNQLLQEKQRGGNPGFQSFMEKHGDFFPPDVTSLDDLIERMQQAAAQMQSLLDSMSPDMRQQLQQLTDDLLRDDRLKWDMAQLASNLERIMPSRQFRGRYPFRGEESLGLEEAMELMKQLQELDQLERQLKQSNGGQQLDGIDSGDIERLLGPEARQSLDQLQQIMKQLEDAGYVQRTKNGWELSARGIRKIGQKALQDIFGKLKRDAFGKHAIDVSGRGGERTHESKAYEFGDSFHLDIQETLMNSLAREGPGTPVHLRPEDFEVYRTEVTTTSATVLMVDMSRSMNLRNCFHAAKKVAVALDSLIRGQYPRDSLYFIAFSDYARELKPDQLPSLETDDSVYGTNMHHAFMLARHLLSKHKGANKQIIMVTDGEPTAHLEGTQSIFSYPPTYQTVAETLKEVGRCTRDQIVINTFMLERGHYLVDFINQMTRINRGRAFYSTPDQLGEYVLVDYVANKRKIVR